MHYSVKMTMYAINQMRETVSYISHELESPQTALKWAEILEKEICGLNTLPSRFPNVEYEPWKSNGIHKMTVRNFIVYYLIDENNKTVWVTAVVYAKRDQINLLKEMPTEKNNF